MPYKKYDLFDERTHPIIISNWMWQMAKEGAIKTGVGTHSAFIRNLLVQHAKDNNYWDWWEKRISKKQKEDK